MPRSLGRTLLAALTALCALAGASCAVRRERPAEPAPPRTTLAPPAAPSVISPAEASARALSIAVHVDEAAGVARRNAPCLAAVPIPRELHVTGTGGDLTLATDAGVPVPCQVRVLSRWGAKPGDATAPIRWVLLAFETDLGSHRTKPFRLVKRTNDFRPELAASVTKRGDAVLLDTGAVRVTLGGAALLGAVTRSSGEVLAKAVHAFVREGDDEASLARRPEVQVLESGPVRAVVRLTGTLSRSLGYALTVTGWAGRSELELSLETRNSDAHTARTVKLTELGLALDLPKPADGAITAEGPRGLTAHDALVLEQLAPAGKAKEGHFELGLEGGARIAEGKEHEGWLVARSGDGSVGVASRKPVGRAPSGARLSKDALTLRFVTPPREDADDRSPRASEASREGPLRNRWLGDLQHRTDQALIFFGATSPAEASEAVASFRSRLQGAPNASWVRDAGGLAGPLGDEADERAAYGAVGLELPAKADRKDALARPQEEIGDINVKWGTESDEARDLFVAWLRTGERGAFDEALAWAEFYRDRYAPRTDGFSFGESESRPRTDKGEVLKIAQTLDCQRVKESHLYGEGLVAHYLLTGDEASLDAAKDLAELVAKRFGSVGPDSPIMEVRVFARPMQLVAALAEVTGEESWRELLARFVACAFSSPTRDKEKGCYAIKMFVGDFDLNDVLPPGLSLPEKFPGDAKKGLFQKGPRQLHIKGERACWPYQDRELAHALARAFEATGDERARQALLGLAEYYLKEGLVPCFYKPEVEITPYCTLPYVPEPEVARYLQPSNAIYTTNLGLTEAAAYLVSGDERFLALAKKCLKIAATRGYRDSRPLGPDDRRVTIATRSQWARGFDDQRTFFALGAGPRRSASPGAPTGLSVRRGPREGTVELRFTPADDRAARWIVQGSSEPVAAFAAEPLGAVPATRTSGASVVVVSAKDGVGRFVVRGEDAHGLVGPASEPASRTD